MTTVAPVPVPRSEPYRCWTCPVCDFDVIASPAGRSLRELDQLATYVNAAITQHAALHSPFPLPKPATANELAILEALSYAGGTAEIRHLNPIPKPSKGGVIRDIIAKRLAHCGGKGRKRWITLDPEYVYTVDETDDEGDGEELD